MGSPILTGVLLVALFVLVSRGLISLVRATFGEDDGLVQYFEHAPRPTLPPTLYVVRTPPFDWDTDAIEYRPEFDD